MKKIILFLLLIPYLSNGQGHSTIHFIGEKSWQKPSFALYLNEKLIGSLQEKQNLDYKIYSSGDITVMALHEHGRKTITLKIENGKEYYIAIKTVNLFKTTMELLSAEKGKKKYDKNKSTLNIEENINDPVAKFSNSNQNKISKQGTGFLINRDGYIITNFHVIDNASKVNVSGIKGDFNTVFEGKVVSVDRRNDLALIKVESNLISFDAPPYSLKSSQEVNKAEKVFALGYPIQSSMGSEVKITDGIINSLSGFKSSISEYQISVAIQGGNSGGPLFNLNGQVIGVVSAKIASDEVDQVGYAIKSDYLDFFLAQSQQTEFNPNTTQLIGKELYEQVELISDFIYIIKTE